MHTCIRTYIRCDTYKHTYIHTYTLQMRYNYVLRAHLSFSPMIISLRLPCRAPKIMPHDSVSLYRAALSLNLSCYSNLSLLKLLVMCHVSCSVSLNLSHHTSIYQIRYIHTYTHACITSSDAIRTHLTIPRLTGPGNGRAQRTDRYRMLDFDANPVRNFFGKFLRKILENFFRTRIQKNYVASWSSA